MKATEEQKSIALGDIKLLENTTDKLASEIKILSVGIRNILNRQIKRSTLILLLQDSTNMSKKDIDIVLYALENLDKRFLKS